MQDMGNIKSILRIVLGNILITMAYAFITVPNEIVNGGVTSFSLLLQDFINVDIGIIVNVITVLLLVICFIFLGKEFFFKSILSSICYMAFFNVFNSLGVDLKINIYIGIILAAVLVAMGYYLCISAKSTAVGFDIIAIILNKKNNKINIAVAMRYINIVIIALGFMNYGYLSILLGIIFTIIQSSVLKYLLNLSVSVKKENVTVN